MYNCTKVGGGGGGVIVRKYACTSVATGYLAVIHPPPMIQKAAVDLFISTVQESNSESLKDAKR